MVQAPGNTPPIRRRLPPEERRAQILDVALTVFSELGYAASMGDVAKRAGVTRTVLYHYFATKQELFLAVSDRLLTELLRVIAPAIASDASPEERARAGIAVFLEFARKWPDALNVLLPQSDDAGREVKAMREQVEEQLLTAVGSLVAEDAEAAGVDLDGIEGQVMARSVLGGVVYVLNWCKANPGISVNEVADAIFRLYWRGVAWIADAQVADPRTL